MARHLQDRRSIYADVVLLLAFLVCFICGCGGNPVAPSSSALNGKGQSTAAPVPGDSTTALVLFSSKANDELADFQLSLGTLTLTDADGKSVTVFDSRENRPAEFMHSNSILDPVTSVLLPQDVYTSATLTFSSSQFSFVTYNAGYIYFNTAASLSQGTYRQAQITLPNPITISGQSVELIVDLDMSQSVSLSGSPQENNFSSSVTPSFSVMELPPQGTQNSSGAAQVNVLGQIGSPESATGGNSLMLNLPSGSALTVMSDSNTIYQGIDGQDSLLPGMFVDVDLVLQQDGSLLAKRWEVLDSTARDLVAGPIFNIDPSAGIFNLVGEQEQGQDFSSGYRSGGMALQFTSDTKFRIYGGFQVPAELPFTPIFDRTSIVAGQNLAATSQSIPLSGPYPTVTTLTLLPQTVDCIIASVTSNNGLQVYTLNLASYDPLSTRDRILKAYVGAQTRLLNSTPLQPGQILRFHGMVFSGPGTLEMVADQVNDGVAE